ncbi:MAG: ECF transporter S component [Oscillospiraceae bacterium]|nr:ECF transporter S component [Oscillospiraceae bacterium]
MKNPDLKIKKLVRAALLLAVGMVLPFLTMQNADLGNALLPMHLPVMLCGYLCGGWYGLAVGAILPFLRSVCFGMPSPMYPRAVWMAVELATYGAVTGFLYKGFFKKKLWWLYGSLLSAMVAGRILYGIVKWALLLESKNPLTMEVFIAGAVVEALPGIVLQLVLVPVIVKAIEKWENRGA